MAKRLNKGEIKRQEKEQNEVKMNKFLTDFVSERFEQDDNVDLPTKDAYDDMLKFYGTYEGDKPSKPPGRSGHMTTLLLNLGLVTQSKRGKYRSGRLAGYLGVKLRPKVDIHKDTIIIPEEDIDLNTSLSDSEPDIVLPPLPRAKREIYPVIKGIENRKVSFEEMDEEDYYQLMALLERLYSNKLD